MADYRNDYTTSYVTNVEPRTSSRSNGDSRGVSVQIGYRYRGPRVNTRPLPSGLRPFTRYVRNSKHVTSMTPTIRLNGGGVIATIWPERTPYIHKGGDAFPATSWVNAENRAVTECMNRILEQKVQFGNDLLEARSTFKMVTDTAKQAATGLLHIKRGQWRQAFNTFGLYPRQLPKTLGDKWLEWTYGWKPTADSLYEYQELLKKKSIDKSAIIRAVREIKIGPYEWFPDKTATGYWWSATGSVKMRGSVKVILYVKFNNTYSTMAREWGVSSPLGILWEAVPYSFVVDWFLPIGNVISAWDARSGVEFITGGRTRRGTGNGTFSCVAVALTNSWNSGTVLEPSRIAISHEYMDRQPYTAMPYPLPYVKSPFSDSHAVSAMALIRQLW